MPSLIGSRWAVQRGAELDLRRAFDSVPHAIALLAGRSVGLSEIVLVYFCTLVWPAPRGCTVAGGPASRDVWPVRGLPQGSARRRC